MNAKSDAGYRSAPRDHNGALPRNRNHFGHIAIDLLRQLMAGNREEALHEIALIRRAHGTWTKVSYEDELAECELMLNEGRIRDAERFIDGHAFSRDGSLVNAVYSQTPKMGELL
jgi:hypothetical protein